MISKIVFAVFLLLCGILSCFAKRLNSDTVKVSAEQLAAMMGGAAAAKNRILSDMRADPNLRTYITRIEYNYTIDASVLDVYLTPYVEMWPDTNTLRILDLEYGRAAAVGRVRIRWPLDFAQKCFFK